MTLIFIMTPEVMVQGSRYQEVCMWTCLLVFFAIFLHITFPSFSLFVSLFLFSFILHSYLIFLFWPCLFTETSRAFEKRQGRSLFSELNFFFKFESFCCPPSMCLRTDTMSIQGRGTGTYKEININRIRE